MIQILQMYIKSPEQWSNFKTLMLRVSIDDYGEQNDYIRLANGS